MAKKKKTRFYELRWNGELWALYRAGRFETAWGRGTKAVAESRARNYCRHGWEYLKEPGVLRIKNLDGKIGRGGDAVACYGV